MFFDFLIGFSLFKFKPRLGVNLLTLNLLVNTIATVFLVINGSAVSTIMAWVSHIVLLGHIVFPSFRSVLKIIGSYVINVVYATKKAVLHFMGFHRSGSKISISRILRIVLIPIVVFFLFSLLYKSANPVFNTYYKKFVKTLGEWLGNIDGVWLFLFFIGLVFTAVLILTGEKLQDYFLRKETRKVDELVRSRKQGWRRFKMNALKTEYKIAVILFAGLNILLAFFNLTDIRYLWMGFEWDGGFLKSYVHEGTYILIFSLLLSMVVTLYYFRRNLNFISGNKLLKILGVVWLAQNVFMLFSVGLRNYYYIQHFALAHKRIGVYFFLAICLVGILSSMLKVTKNKSLFYLEKVNSNSVYILLVLMACFNWDIIIAKYNFKHYDKSFLHLDYMLALSNKALPYIDVQGSELEQIDSTQSSKVA